MPASTVRQRSRGRIARDFALIGFAVTVAVILVSGTLSYWSLRSLAEDQQQVTRTHKVIAAVEAVLSTVKDAETGQRGYVLTGNPAYLQPYEDALKRIDEDLANLDQRTASDPEQQLRLAVVRRQVAAKLDEIARTVALVRQGDRQAALRVIDEDEGIRLMDAVRDSTAAMVAEERRLLDLRGRASVRNYQSGLFSVLLTSFLGIVLVVAVAVLSYRNATHRRREAAVLAEQRELLRATFESIGDAAVTTDIGNRVTNMNSVAETLTGWRRDDALGKPLDTVFQVIDENTRQRIESPAARALREARVVQLSGESVLVNKDGTETPIDDSASPIRGADGGVLGAVLVFRDVAAKREADEKVRMSEERFRSLVTATVAIVWVTDGEGRFVTEQPSWAAYTGQKWEEYRDFGWLNAVHAEDRDHFWGSWLEACRAGVPYRLEGRLHHGASDTFRHIEVRGVPVRAADGAIREWVGKCLDVEDEKRAEQRVYGLVSELQEADRRKDEFLAMLAHELRGPLAPLSNMLEVMRRADDDEKVRRQARDTMERQLALMVRLIDDLLDVSRISRGKLVVRREHLDLRPLLEQAVEAARALLEGKDMELSLELPDEPVSVDADAARLAQVFGNLLSNAIKYTEPPGHVRMRAECSGGEAVIAVRDDGIGIAADDLPKVFDMFTQLDSAAHGSQSGLGIGLTLVRRLVEMHDGVVEVFSEGRGRGSEFVVRLPLAEDVKSRARADGKERDHAAPARRFLIVDDYRETAESLSLLLQVSGYETAMALDGVEAIAAARDFHPDVVLMDIGLPKMDGCEVARRIRAEPWGKDMVLVAVTGWGQESDRRLSMDAGFDYHLVKPLDFSALMKILAQA